MRLENSPVQITLILLLFLLTTSYFVTKTTSKHCVRKIGFIIMENYSFQITQCNQFSVVLIFLVSIPTESVALTQENNEQKRIR